MMVQAGVSRDLPASALFLDNARLIAYDGVGSNMQKYGSGTAEVYASQGPVEYPRSAAVDLRGEHGYTIAMDGFWVSLATINTAASNRLSWTAEFEWVLMSKTQQLVLRSEQTSLA